jgi:hypothetical protein
VSYQTNDFVNPNQRGVELPPGCKDLNELLQQHMGVQKRKARPIFPIKPGSMKDIPRYVQAVYMENYGESLVVIIRAANAILYVHNAPSGSRLTFLLKNQQAGLATAVQELSANIGFRDEVREGVKRVSIPLPHLWLEAAQIVEKVIGGCGAAENADLLFYFVTRAE